MSLITPTATTLLRATSTYATSTASCTTAVPDKNGYVPPDSCNANYGFYPQWEDNLGFAVAFGLTTIVHLVQAIVLKKRFSWVVIMGSLWECVCFVLRAVGAKDQQQAAYMVSSTLLFLLAPLWINAFVYMIVARLVYFLHPQHRHIGIPAQWLAKCFVSADVVCFIVQAAGGWMMSDQNDKDKAKLGQKIYMAGCGVQMACVLVFLVVHGLFHREMIHFIRIGKVKVRHFWTTALFWVIYVVLFLIIVRVIFRLVEFSQGASTSNDILRHEAYQLYLDALPMLFAISVLNIVHPGMVLKGPQSNLPKTKLRWWRGSASAFEPVALDSFETSKVRNHGREPRRGSVRG